MESLASPKILLKCANKMCLYYSFLLLKCNILAYQISQWSIAPFVQLFLEDNASYMKIPFEVLTHSQK